MQSFYFPRPPDSVICVLPLLLINTRDEQHVCLYVSVLDSGSALTVARVFLVVSVFLVKIARSMSLPFSLSVVLVGFVGCVVVVVWPVGLFFGCCTLLTVCCLLSVSCFELLVADCYGVFSRFRVRPHISMCVSPAASVMVNSKSFQ